MDLKPRIIEQENVDTDEANPETTGEPSTDPKTGLPEQREQDTTSPKPRNSGRVRRKDDRICILRSTDLRKHRQAY